MDWRYHAPGFARSNPMKLAVFLMAVITSVALSAPADASPKKSKKVAHRAPVGAVHSPSSSQDVYVGGELVGRDPDPAIRAYMMRDPKPWIGND
jgi:hypothetical protein